MYSLFEESFNSTVAHPPLVQEHERLAFTIERLVREDDPFENLFKLRRLTGYSAGQLASLLKVSRETVENWLRGGEVPRDDVSHINKVLSVVQFSDRGAAEDNARALEDDSLGEITPFEAIKSHRYTEAMRWLSFSPVQSKKMERGKSVWGNAIGEFQPMLFHDAADGAETQNSAVD